MGHFPVFRLPQTLLWRLCLALLAIQFTIALTLGWYGYRSVRAFHLEQSLHQLERLTQLLVTPYSSLLRVNDGAGLDRRAKDDGRASGVRITLVGADGSVLADSHHELQDMSNHLSRPEVLSALSDGVGQAIRFSDTIAMDMLYRAEVFRINGEEVVIRTALPLTAVKADLSQLVRAIGAAFLLVFTVTVALSYLVSRKLSVSISHISGRAAAIASEGTYEPIELAWGTEFAPLIQALNRMSSHLHDRIAQLQIQQHEHESILQSMNSGIIALDLHQRILRTNRTADRMLGIRDSCGGTDSAKGRLLQEVVRIPELNRFVDAAMRDSITGPAEFRLRVQPELIVQATSGSLSDPDGKTHGVLIVLNDVTALRRLESLRSDFAANVSHELRTPITNIKGYVETLLEVGVSDPEQAIRFLEIIRRNSNRLAAIVEDILALAWLEQPGTRLSLERESCCIKPILQSVAVQFENAALAKGITMKIEAPEELAAPVNRQLIEQAVANYVSNAIKYSAPNTTVTISAKAHSDQWAEIAVADLGGGIAREHLPRVFERFYRVDKARSRELGGTGLGLAIVKHIALVHGGRVEVESTLGERSTFKILLPMNGAWRGHESGAKI
jgi:two-component system, OmpR family, phosphate regulon sensor histidine kinase PhoR